LFSSHCKLLKGSNEKKKIERIAAKSPFQAILPNQFRNIVTKLNAPGPSSSSSTPYRPFPRKISFHIFSKKDKKKSIHNSIYNHY